jgi:hypothetical protein
MNSIGRTTAALLLAASLTTGIVAAQQSDAGSQPQPALSVEQPVTQETDSSEADGGAQEIVADCKAERGEPGEPDRGIGDCVSEAVHERNESRQEEVASEKQEAASQTAETSKSETSKSEETSQAPVQAQAAQDSEGTNVGQGAQEIVDGCKEGRGGPGETDRGIGECVSEAVQERNDVRQEERAAEQASNHDQAASSGQAATHGRVEAQAGRH